MPAKANTVVTTDLSAVREVDFVTRFTREIAILRDLLGSVRKERHEPGTKLTVKSAAVTLNTSAVGEGVEIPYNAVSYTETDIGTLTFDKQSIGVSLEAISKSGYEAAIQKADDDLLYKLRSGIVDKFVTFMQTGTLASAATISDFQMALAEALGQVQTKWENMDRGYSEIIGFVNVLDAYRYLGAASITTQTAFGMTYLKDFLGFNKLFLTSKVPTGKVIATPAENIVLYYVDATENDFSKAGFEFRTDGEENLIAVHVEGNHRTMVSELTTVTGMGLFAEYLDGIANITFGDAQPAITIKPSSTSVKVGATKKLTAEVRPAGSTITWASSDTTKATVSNGTVTGVATGTASITASITVDSVTYTDTTVVTVTAS